MLVQRTNKVQEPILRWFKTANHRKIGKGIKSWGGALAAPGCNVAPPLMVTPQRFDGERFKSLERERMYYQLEKKKIAKKVFSQWK